MKFYSQKDALWRDKKLGFGRSTFGQAGCAIVSITNGLALNGSNLTPLYVNQLAKDSKAFQGDMLVFPTLAKTLGYDYKKVYETEAVSVAETDNYKKMGVPQHFFIYNPSINKRIDPLDLTPDWEKNDYHIVSYRVFTKTSNQTEPSPSTSPLPINVVSGDNSGDNVEIVPDTLKPVETPPSSNSDPIEPPAMKPTENGGMKIMTFWVKVVEFIQRLFNLK